MMKFKLLSFFALLASVSAVQPGSRKAVDDLKSTLEKIKGDLLSMKSSINVAASFVDGFTTKHVVDSPKTVDKAAIQLSEQNLPEPCFQEATKKLTMLNEVVVPNCSVVHIGEDIGDLVYNSANFVALSMMTMDDLLGGIENCGHWYIFWRYFPCVFSYAWTSYEDIKSVVNSAIETFQKNEQKAVDIIYQIECKANQVSMSSYLSTSRIINEANLCAKNSGQSVIN